jgi:hypothetical protein
MGDTKAAPSLFEQLDKALKADGGELAKSTKVSFIELQPVCC